MNSKAYTLEEVLALSTAAKQAMTALLPLRDQYKYPAPEYSAMNRIINAAAELSDRAATQWVDAHIIPAPANPAPGFTAKLAELAEDLRNPAHLNFPELADLPVILTGRTYVSINGATWYEIDTQDELNGNDWVSSDVDADPRGFSSKYEHCAHDVRGYML